MHQKLSTLTRKTQLWLRESDFLTSIERDLYREEAQALTDRMTSLKQEMEQQEVQFSGQLEESNNRCRKADLALLEVQAKHSRLETELRSRDNVRPKSTRSKLDGKPIPCCNIKSYQRLFEWPPEQGCRVGFTMRQKRE